MWSIRTSAWMAAAACAVVSVLAADVSASARPGAAVKKGSPARTAAAPPSDLIDDAKPGVSVVPASSPAAPKPPDAEVRTRLADPREADPMPRKEGVDDEGYTVVQVPGGFFRYQREPGESAEKDAGFVTLTPRSYVADRVEVASAGPAARVESKPARNRPPPPGEEKPCRRERALLAQRVLALRGLPDVDVDTADLVMSELEGGPSWVATAVLGTGGWMPRHPAFPWQPGVMVDGQVLVPAVPAPGVPNGASSATHVDPVVRWRLDDLAKCQARERRERDLAR